MPQKITLNIVFAFAALLFIAKPFLGFTAFNKQAKPRISHSILVKSFTKRKPEDLRDGHAKAQALHQMIADPPLKLASSILLLMAVLLPFTIENITKLTQRVIAAIGDFLTESAPAWLLTGKLSI
ncbi:MAG TPA: hypothetical protein VHS53_11200 [Mucilaginibacter sp.]|jgi:hypothetical protein|nr:hypothetical protein [Mucilaginibacter sp.]